MVARASCAGAAFKTASPLALKGESSVRIGSSPATLESKAPGADTTSVLSQPQ